MPITHSIPATPPLPIAERLVARRPLLVRARGLSVHAALLGVLGALSFAVARVLPQVAPGLLSLGGAGLFACPFRAATGIPCPSCGATHAFVRLAHGQLASGLSASPLFALAALSLWAGALFVLCRLIGLAAGHAWTVVIPAPRPGMARALRWGTLGLIGVNWAFVVFVSRGGAP